MFVCVTDGVTVGFVVGVFVGVIVGKLIEVVVATKSGVSTESTASVGVDDEITVGLGVGVSRMRGGVGNGRAASIGPTVTVKNGIGMTGKLYRPATSSPKIPRYPARNSMIAPTPSARQPWFNFFRLAWK